MYLVPLMKRLETIKKDINYWHIQKDAIRRDAYVMLITKVEAAIEALQEANKKIDPVATTGRDSTERV